MLTLIAKESLLFFVVFVRTGMTQHWTQKISQNFHRFNHAVWQSLCKECEKCHI